MGFNIIIRFSDSIYSFTKLALFPKHVINNYVAVKHDVYLIQKTYRKEIMFLVLSLLMA